MGKRPERWKRQDGTKSLLADGLMGVGRKLNYAGDICCYLAFGLTAGTLSFYPYILFLIVLSGLMYRAYDDD